TIYVGGVAREIVRARDTQRGWLAGLADVSTRNEAEALPGQIVDVDREALALGEDDILLEDLVGCELRLADGAAWGTVVAVDPGAFQDLLVIHHGDIERLLPLVDEFVPTIDLDAGVITVDPPEGLPESPVKKR